MKTYSIIDKKTGKITHQTTSLSQAFKDAVALSVFSKRHYLVKDEDGKLYGEVG